MIRGVVVRGEKERDFKEQKMIKVLIDMWTISEIREIDKVVIEKKGKSTLNGTITHG